MLGKGTPCVLTSPILGFDSVHDKESTKYKLEEICTQGCNCKCQSMCCDWNRNKNDEIRKMNSVLRKLKVKIITTINLLKGKHCEKNRELSKIVIFKNTLDSIINYYEKRSY